MGEPNRLKKVAKKKKGDHSGKGITKDPGKSDVRGKAIEVESKSKGPFIKDMLEAGGIMDMDFPRPAFTWLNGRQGAAKIQERIDWCWCNASWRLKMPSQKKEAGISKWKQLGLASRLHICGRKNFQGEQDSDPLEVHKALWKKWVGGRKECLVVSLRERRDVWYGLEVFKGFWQIGSPVISRTWKAP
ncbi:hypothetical protein M9H77_08982 [Catharanthus roseus]|uniref:Uncharacterized protein n=1 Tax=Catharanthus roseus TaxID=4058 RepID=A0ACC0BZI2_CATRO|nr:hypothetical protein M9H77_08982 [Catharanthus roseus]